MRVSADAGQRRRGPAGCGLGQVPEVMRLAGMAGYVPGAA